MLKKLKKAFPSMIVYGDDYDRLTNYKWFNVEENKIIGIDENELTERDTSILAAFLSPYNINFPLQTEDEKIWKKRIKNGSDNKTVTPYRFVYFSIKKNQIDPKSFKEALDVFFTTPVPIIWENETEGVIIEEKTLHEDDAISYEQIIDVLMSDLYVKINFLVGPYFDNLENIDQYYISFVKSGNTAFTYSDKSVITYIDAFASIVVDQAGARLRNEMITIVLRELAADDELLHTVKTFIECNLNVSLAAKELYMHRNSLQYRLDKFIDKTGVDIRQFNQAMVVYLALLANMHKSL
ncbi:uncharacterized protein YodC (DUF2158 family) [Virgibacillus natechei]|uniref:Uncharacterized protein YodC (DUF2158 family) n=1 Tax=Virgibacillus natechei TaxID=1216297 RepID=A0ABS4IDE8_9BACI|nr:helix-turn-helix domain-containing protein [Virgibacillus natechei]MBP1968965.1 uncharacterized protein YodC (DUF2158 family) [Virgibacillus natechei]UZD14244.1 helix-turn-helix domain-containing protein [Virgibacillus natechei]